MICQSCSSSNLDSARFCSDCGTSLRLDNISSSQASEQEEITLVRNRERGEEATIEPGGSERLLNSTIASKYRIDAKLGAGGMGTVYRSTRLLIGDDVAIKILHAEQSDPRAAERFRREAQAAARLKHPNAVTIYDFGVTHEGLQYLVMELVEGESLRQIIKQQGPLTPPAAAEIMNQVCAALDEAHQHNVLHRDLKPDNIIVSRNKAGLRVKVLDFGIAKLRDDTAGNLTQTGSILGTPHYMSPEQCLGEELDGRSDIYSLGVVAYEMLTGLVPFNSPSSSGVVVQHVTQEPPPLRLLNPSLSPGVELAVLKALEKRRDARPQTAAGFAERLSSAVVDKTQTTSSDSTEAVQIQSSKQGASPTEPTIVVSRLSAPNSPRLDREDAERSQTRNSIGYIGVALVALVLGGVVVWFVRSGGGGNAGNSNAQKASMPLNITATASSVRLPIQLNTYDATNAIDGQRNTAWVEGVNGPGFGEWIRVDFDREIILHRLILQPGYFKSPQIWKENNRIAAVTATFSDGSSREFTFSNLMEDQPVSVGAIKTKWVRFVIKSAYYGSSPGPYDDTGLSEVRFEWEPTN